MDADATAMTANLKVAASLFQRCLGGHKRAVHERACSVVETFCNDIQLVAEQTAVLV
jgi:hypothetical protein